MLVMLGFVSESSLSDAFAFLVGETHMLRLHMGRMLQLTADLLAITLRLIRFLQCVGLIKRFFTWHDH